MLKKIEQMKSKFLKKEDKRMQSRSMATIQEVPLECPGNEVHDDELETSGQLLINFKKNGQFVD